MTTEIQDQEALRTIAGYSDADLFDVWVRFVSTFYASVPLHGVLCAGIASGTVSFAALSNIRASFAAISNLL